MSIESCNSSGVAVCDAGSLAALEPVGFDLLMVADALSVQREHQSVLKKVAEARMILGAPASSVVGGSSIVARQKKR